MPVGKHAFQVFNPTKKLSIIDSLPPKERVVTINVSLQNPPNIIKFQGKDVVLVLSTVNLRIEEIAEVLMRGETLYRFKDEKEKSICLRNLKENKRLPHDVEKEILNQIAARAVLSVTKAHFELGIPPPIPLRTLEPE